MGKFLWTLFAKTESPTGVDIEKGSGRVLGSTSNFIDTKGIDNNVGPGSNNGLLSLENT